METEASEQLTVPKYRRGTHPNTLKNLQKGRAISHQKGWKPGKSGNPEGHSLTALVKTYLSQVPQIMVGGKPNTKTWRELICQAWLIGVYKGNPALLKELIDRVDGRLQVQVTGPGGGPVVISLAELARKAELPEGQNAP